MVTAALLALPVDDEHQRRSSVGLAISLSGLLLVVLANDWAVVLVGSSLAGVGSYILSTGDGRLFAVGRVADALVVAAAAVFLWGLAGGWTGRGDFVPDFRPRIVSVERGSASPKPDDPNTQRINPGGRTTISSTALPGSTVSLGGAELCEVDHDGKEGGVGTIGRPCTRRVQTLLSRGCALQQR